jgi:hypothetical protein
MRSMFRLGCVVVSLVAVVSNPSEAQGDVRREIQAIVANRVTAVDGKPLSPAR